MNKLAHILGIGPMIFKQKTGVDVDDEAEVIVFEDCICFQMEVCEPINEGIPSSITEAKN